MAKKTKAAEPQADAPVKKPRSKKLLIAVAALAILLPAAGAGGYFALKPVFTETTAANEAAGGEHAASSGPLPVAIATSAKSVEAADYQIESIFDGAAILATADNLIRVKVGSEAPGIGTVTSIESSIDGSGGAVVGTKATLRTL